MVKIDLGASGGGLSDAVSLSLPALLDVTPEATATGGIVAFTNLSHNVATTLTIDFSASGLLGATSGNVVVSPAAATSLVLVQPPSDAAAGVAISPAVTVRAQDSFGNGVSGLPVSITLSTGGGALSGTTSKTTDTNGSVAFSDLSINLVGTKKLTASTGAISTGESDPFTIGPGAATLLVIQTQPSPAATAGVTFAQHRGRLSGIVVAVVKKENDLAADFALKPASGDNFCEKKSFRKKAARLLTEADDRRAHCAAARLRPRKRVFSKIQAKRSTAAQPIRLYQR